MICTERDLVAFPLPSPLAPRPFGSSGTSRFWAQRFDRLDSYLQELQKKEKSNVRKKRNRS